MGIGMLHRSFVGRQPIYRGGAELFAYELLFRRDELQETAAESTDQATADVMLAMMDIGLNRVIGNHPAFVNLTRNFLLTEHCQSLPADRIVLEILETVEPDEEIIRAVRTLRGKGFTIALDDFTYAEEFAPLLQLAHIVKVDVRAHTREELVRQVQLLKPYNVKLLAEKVESHEEYEFCRSIGFDYFQGFFFCKPQMLSEDKLPLSRVTTLRLLAKLQDPNISLSGIEQNLVLDVTLSYKLLSYANSAFMGLARKIDSIRHAVSMVGTERVRTWAGLMMFASVDNKPKELMVSAALRGKMCAELARASGHTGEDKYTTVGLFSMLDALLDRPLHQILELIPLSEDVASALEKRTGPMGEALGCAEAYERGDWDNARFGQLSETSIRDAYLEAVDWSRTVSQQFVM